jgi:hypothetical protein
MIDVSAIYRVLLSSSMLFDLFDTSYYTFVYYQTTTTLYKSNLVLCFLRPNRPVWPVTLGLTERLSQLFCDKCLIEVIFP